MLPNIVFLRPWLVGPGPFPSESSLAANCKANLCNIECPSDFLLICFLQVLTISFFSFLADNGAEFVLTREWMDICLEWYLTYPSMHEQPSTPLATPRIPGSARSSFSWSRARQSQVCSTVAIAIVAKPWGPRLHLTNLEGCRTAKLNMRPECLKALSSCWWMP